MLCSRFLRPSRSQHHGKFYAVTERGFERLRGGYDWSLQGVLRHRPRALLGSFVLIGATAYSIMLLRKSSSTPASATATWRRFAALRCQHQRGPCGQKEFGTKTEVKNVNALCFIKQALEYEIERHIGVIEAGGRITQENAPLQRARRQDSRHALEGSRRTTTVFSVPIAPSWWMRNGKP